MPGQERSKDRQTNEFNRLPQAHSLDPGRSRSPSPILDPQASFASIHDTQPHNSPSLSTICPSIVVNPAEEALGRMADLANAGFQGVKTTLRQVERVADVFPPLKSAVEGLLCVIDIVEVRSVIFKFVF